jgi:hypothetical protein
MKIEFSRSREYVPEFNGNKELPEEEQLKATISVMRLSDLLDLGDTFKEADFEEGDMKNMTLDQMKVLVKGAGQYVPKYVKLSGNDGFALDDVVQFPQFLSLAAELLFTLLSYSQPTTADVKNS